jgi:mannosyltransferase
MDLQHSVNGRLRGKEPFIAVGIILVAALLRFHALSLQPLWYDELISISIASFKGGLKTLWNVRFYPHPPLFSALLYIVLKGLEPSEFSARFLSVFAGVLAFPLLYRYLADVANERIALIALLVLAFSPFHIFYCQEARPYALMFTLVVLTMWVLHKALAEGGIGWWLAHAMCILGLLYLHFFDWAVVGGEVLYMLLTWRRNRHGLVPFALSLMVFPLAIPPLLGLLRDSQKAGDILVLNAVPVSISLTPTWKTLVAGEVRYVTPQLRLSGLLAFAVLALAGGIGLARYRPNLLVLTLSMLAVPFFFVFVVLRAMGHIVPPYEDKQFIVILPFALTMAASGVELLWSVQQPSWTNAASRLAAAGLLVVLLGGNLLSLWSYYSSFEKNADIRVLEYLDSHVEPGDIVVYNSLSPALNSWFHWEVSPRVKRVTWPLHSGGEWHFSEELRTLAEERIPRDTTLEDVLAHPRVWLVSQDTFGASQLTADMLALVPATSIEDLGPFSVYLLVP